MAFFKQSFQIFGSFRMGKANGWHSTLRNRWVSKYGLLENEAKQQVIQFDIQKIQKAIEGNWSESSIEKYGQYNASSIIEFGLQDK